MSSTIRAKPHGKSRAIEDWNDDFLFSQPARRELPRPRQIQPKESLVWSLHTNSDDEDPTITPAALAAKRSTTPSLTQSTTSEEEPDNQSIRRPSYPDSFTESSNASSFDSAFSFGPSISHLPISIDDGGDTEVEAFGDTSSPDCRGNSSQDVKSSSNTTRSRRKLKKRVRPGSVSSSIDFDAPSVQPKPFPVIASRIPVRTITNTQALKSSETLGTVREPAAPTTKKKNRPLSISSFLKSSTSSTPLPPNTENSTQSRRFSQALFGLGISNGRPPGQTMKSRNVSGASSTSSTSSAVFIHSPTIPKSASDSTIVPPKRATSIIKPKPPDDEQPANRRRRPHLKNLSISSLNISLNLPTLRSRPNSPSPNSVLSPSAQSPALPKTPPAQIKGATLKRPATAAPNYFNPSPNRAQTLAVRSAHSPGNTSIRTFASGNTVLGRRLSLTDLKVPARITNAQKKIENELRMIKDFKKGIEDLKDLCEQHDSYRRRSISSEISEVVRIRDEYSVWWECAEVLIDLAEGTSTSQAAEATFTAASNLSNSTSSGEMSEEEQRRQRCVSMMTSLSMQQDDDDLFNEKSVDGQFQILKNLLDPPLKSPSGSSQASLGLGRPSIVPPSPSRSMSSPVIITYDQIASPPAPPQRPSFHTRSSSKSRLRQVGRASVKALGMGIRDALRAFKLKTPATTPTSALQASPAKSTKSSSSSEEDWDAPSPSRGRAISDATFRDQSNNAKFLLNAQSLPKLLRYIQEISKRCNENLELLEKARHVDSD